MSVLASCSTGASSNEKVRSPPFLQVPASELAAARAQIAQLQRMLGKKTMEAEILKEAVEFAREKNVWSAPFLQAQRF